MRLLAAAEFDGPARLGWVRPGTLRASVPPLRLGGEFVADFALSPDGGRIAVGAAMRGSIQLDLRRWRRLGAVELPRPRPPAAGGAPGLVWASARRLLALSGLTYGAPATPVVVDPVRRRVLHEADWGARPLQPQARPKPPPLGTSLASAFRRGPSKPSLSLPLTLSGAPSPLGRADTVIPSAPDLSAT